jgi:2-polyprenyl-3-methyl-5-hydroxy-6-metoxy-1,4-benzoquinol methylase
VEELQTDAHDAEPSGERFEPVAMHGLIIEAEHLARYAWATQLAEGKRALDAACGMGYGSRMLADAGAREVVGLDLDKELIAGLQGDAPDNVTFEAGDLRRLPFPDDDFDLITCFESIEHVPDPELVLDELRRVLRPGGIVVISTPNRDVYTPGNPFHLRELTPNELEAELAERFASVRLQRQHTWIASSVFEDEEFRADGNRLLEEIELRKAAGMEPGEETYTLAIAGDGPLPSTIGLVDLTIDVDLREWSRFMERSSHEAEVARKRLEEEPRAEAELLRAELEELRRRLIESESELARFAGLEARLQSAEGVLREGETAIAQYQSVIRSPSWRITAPLRWLKATLRALRR